MAAWRVLSWFVVLHFWCYSSARVVEVQPFEYHGICKSVHCETTEALLQQLNNCTVVIGNLQLLLFEKTQNFTGITFPKLKEITGYMVVYRVRGLESLGDLFPNLARIRGNNLLYNYALIVYDMPNLREIGLYNLLKIDRGGVVVWEVPQVCFVRTVDWAAVAPRARHVLADGGHCASRCTCTSDPTTNYCWNLRKCQRFLEGPEASVCSSQCLGCRKTKSTDCSLCKNYTHKGQCVAKCPNDTIVLPVNLYCLSHEECDKLGGWEWDSTCVFDCPPYHVRRRSAVGISCRRCRRCTETCDSQYIRNLESIQAAGRCVYINGSLTIHVTYNTAAVHELTTYLKGLQEVSDYIMIFGSSTLTSLAFLSSLQRIGGRNLKKEKYSILVYDMQNLQTLFSPNVTKNLKIDRGTINFHGNPMLCMSEIEKLQTIVPTQPDELDVPQGMNGYSRGCKEISLGLQLKALNETSALVLFSPLTDVDVHYSVLYVKLNQGTNEPFIPETCSKAKWLTVDVAEKSRKMGIVHLSALQPASTYAVCMETYDPVHRKLARSSILTFMTHVGKPAPPFILELVASSPEVVVIRWVDHKDFGIHIVRYELDVSLIEINSKDVTMRDHCAEQTEELDELDYSRHAVVLRPPPGYGASADCESMCGVLASATAGAMLQDYFEICRATDRECDSERGAYAVGNTSVGQCVRTLSLNISAPRRDFQVGRLAPYRDYRFRLRACTEVLCSRATSGVVRTLRKPTADIPVVVSVGAEGAGHVAVSWAPPAETNGPIFTYTVEVLPNIDHFDLNTLLPQAWCVPGNETEALVRSEVASKYLVRVCATSLGSSRSCGEWRPTRAAVHSTTNWWWFGLPFGVFVCICSTVIGWLCRGRSIHMDRTPLIGSGIVIYRNESEPPNLMMTDFAPVYSIPLRDTTSE